MKPITLLEITFSETPQVDREAGVIRGVRILGRASKNGREYSDAALQQAARFYERLGVNLNHPERPQAEGARDVEDGFGWLEAIDIRTDGVYGDLHYFRAHPQADLIVEAAERNPRRFGLSHHAEGRVARRQGRLVVESIESVRSVDVVQNPATNLGLFESENPPVPRTIREILQETDRPLAELIEDIAYQPASEEVIEIPAGLPGEAQVEFALQSLLVRLLENEQLPLPTRLQQADRLLAAHCRGDQLEEENTKDASTLSQLLERVERIEAEAHCRALLEAAHREIDLSRLAALVELPSDDERSRLIESWTEHNADRFNTPRPRASRPLYEQQPAAAVWPSDAKSFVAALR